MDEQGGELNEYQAAAAVALDVTVVRAYAQRGMIAPMHGYTVADLAELRRVRRLMEDLELDAPAIDIVLRMRRQLLALQAEVRWLEAELQRARRGHDVTTLTDAMWTDV